MKRTLAGCWRFVVKAMFYACVIIYVIVMFCCGAANAAFHTAQVTGVYDGDTITVDINVGFGVILAGQRIRLEGINAPELFGESREAGIAARDWLREKILGKFIILDTSYKKGKYGRWVAYVLFGNENINKELVSAGHAVVKKYD